MTETQQRVDDIETVDGRVIKIGTEGTRIPATILVGGKRTGDWTIPVDANGRGCPTRQFLERIAYVADIGKVLKVLVPTSNFSGVSICSEYQFKDIFPVSGIIVCCDRVANGVVLPPNTGVFFATSGSPTVIACDKRTGKMVVSVAHRDSLVDRYLVATNKATKLKYRMHRSIVDSMMVRLEPRCEHDIQVFTFCSVNARYFKHWKNDPVFGTFNSKLIEHVISEYGTECVEGSETEKGCVMGNLSLQHLTGAQFMRHGVPRDNISHHSLESNSHHLHDRRRGDPGQTGVFVFRSDSTMEEPSLSW